MDIKCPKCDTDNPSDSKFCKECATALPGGEVRFTKTLETPAGEFTRGTTIAGRYEIIEALGTGGMGRVYRVEDTKLNQEIALKLLKHEIAQDKKTIERFRNELKLARTIRHKNVCAMFDLGEAEAESAHFITMEYVRGEDLKSFIHRSGQLAVGTAVRLAKQIAEGLAEAHKLGVVHRDLKPGNIMIDKEGNARIMDFGIARSLASKGITGAGVMIGTPEYMSPEQVEGKDVDSRSDIYSLGIVLYEMVTGRVPFEGDTPLSVAVKQKTEPPRAPKEFNSQISDDLSHVILRCMEKEKERRYQAAGELLSVLNRIEEGIPTTERTVLKKKPVTSKEITVTFGMKKLIVPILAVLAVVATAIILLTTPKLNVDPDLVAVAVFENNTGDPSLDKLGRMVADQITEGLSQVDQIEVVPSMNILQSSWMEGKRDGRVQGTNQLRALGKETGAGTLVSGIYHMMDGVLQFHVNITDIKQGKLHDSFSSEGPLDKPMDLIENVRQRVMGMLSRTPFFLGEAWQSSHKPTFEAFQEYYAGMEYFGSDYARSLKHLERAAELDPDFMAPRLRIATILGNIGDHEKRQEMVDSIDLNREKLTDLERTTLDWMKASIEGKNEQCFLILLKAEEIAPRDLVVRYLIGNYAVRTNRSKAAVVALTKYRLPEEWYDFVPGAWWHGYLSCAYHMLGNFKKELKSIRVARSYYPSMLSIRAHEVRALAAMGKVEEIHKVIDESIPVRSEIGTAGQVMREAGLHLRLHGYKEASFEVLERAVDWYEGMPEKESGTQAQRSGLANALYKAERWEEAKRIYEALHEEFPDDEDNLGYLGALAARRGESEKARGISDQLRDITRPYLFGNHTYWRACIAALLGEKENAVGLLREALEQGISYWRLYSDMDLEPLFDFPPFQELRKPKNL